VSDLAAASLPLQPNERINLASVEVLLVDSAAESLEIMAQMFAGFGVQMPHRADSCANARQQIGERNFNLIVIDAAMSDGDGYGLVQWVRREAGEPNRFASVILLTGHTRASEVYRGRDVGANFVIRKPASPMIMMHRILWLSRDKRDFIEAPGYCGPDRRFRKLGPPNGVKGRRKDDLSAQVGEATAPNLDQSEIDALFQPRRAG
jgi:DNA-binding response OmpR family regulator